MEPDINTTGKPMQAALDLLNKPVIIFDNHGGIYYGRLDDVSTDCKVVKLTGMRHGYKMDFGTDGKGNYSAATCGPHGGLIGPRVNAVITGVSKIVECEAIAIDRWEKIA